MPPVLLALPVLIQRLPVHRGRRVTPVLRGPLVLLARKVTPERRARRDLPVPRPLFPALPVLPGLTVLLVPLARQRCQRMRETARASVTTG